MATTNFHREIRINKFKSMLVMLLFGVLIFGISLIFGYAYNDFFVIPTFAIIFGIIYMLIMFYSGDSVILKIAGARPVEKKEFPHLFHTVEGLALAAGLPTPKAYVIEDKAPNAFATGRDPKHASIAVTTGLLDIMNREELEGVIAHEMAHIKNYDVRLMMLATVLVGVVTLLADFFLRSMIFGGMNNRRDNNNGNAQILFLVIGLVLAILAPFIAQLIRLAVSRKREFVADAEGARLTRYPEGLASALEKLKNNTSKLKNANHATEPLYINNPFKKGFWHNLFATHPPIEERIKKLRSM